MSKPLDTHDVRQAAYRGKGQESEQTGIPDGKERHDPSAVDAPLPTTDETERAGSTLPNLGQAGSYGAGNEETEVTSRNREDNKESRSSDSESA